MNVTVRLTKNFKAELKPLLKKYPSLPDDLLQLEEDLKKNPQLGSDLGKNAYKIRLRIKSKGKGKRSGARVISFVEHVVILGLELAENETTVNLISIYDKGETDTITDNELKKLIHLFHDQK